MKPRRPVVSSRIFSWSPALILYLLITLQSCFEMPSDDIEIFPHQDKVGHFFVYGLLGALLARGAFRGGLRRISMGSVIIGASLVAMVLGIIDEVHQTYTPGRFSDAGDVLADTVGALAGASLYGAIVKRIGRRGGHDGPARELSRD